MMRYVAILALTGWASLAVGLERQPSVSELIKAEIGADSNCRGSADPDAFETKMECDRRARLVGRLSQIGWCYGRKGQVGGDYQWHRCDAQSNVIDDITVSRQP